MYESLLIVWLYHNWLYWHDTKYLVSIWYNNRNNQFVGSKRKIFKREGMSEYLVFIKLCLSEWSSLWMFLLNKQLIRKFWSVYSGKCSPSNKLWLLYSIECEYWKGRGRGIFFILFNMSTFLFAFYLTLVKEEAAPWQLSLKRFSERVLQQPIDTVSYLCARQSMESVHLFKKNV